MIQLSRLPTFFYVSFPACLKVHAKYQISYSQVRATEAHVSGKKSWRGLPSIHVWQPSPPVVAGGAHGDCMTTQTPLPACEAYTACLRATSSDVLSVCVSLGPSVVVASSPWCEVCRMEAPRSIASLLQVQLRVSTKGRESKDAPDFVCRDMAWKRGRREGLRLSL